MAVAGLQGVLALFVEGALAAGVGEGCRCVFGLGRVDGEFFGRNVEVSLLAFEVGAGDVDLVAGTEVDVALCLYLTGTLVCLLVAKPVAGP